jgi:hypothetical protein
MGPVSGSPVVARGRPTALAVVVAVVGVAVLARIPLIGLPLDSDEGGYALVAHRWAVGAPLYSLGAWVDRPPGLVLVFRLVDAVSYSALAMRAAAAVAAAVLALAAAATAWALEGRRAGLVTGLVVGVVLAGPWLQGYQLNGEILAGALAATAVAVACWWRAGALATPWLVAAGALAAAAPLMKQSGFDGIVVVLAVAAAARPARRPVLLALVGMAVPVGVTLALAVRGGWGRWWYALVGSEAQLSALQPALRRVGSVLVSLALVQPDGFGLLVAAVLGAVLTWRRRRRTWPALVWLAAAVAGACLGPFGHPHYWVQAVAPAAVVAGLVVPRVPSLAPRTRAAVTAALAAAVVLPLAGQVFVVAHPAAERPGVLTTDRQVAANPAVAAWLDAHTRPHDEVFAFAASAAVYVEARRDTAFPYLWYGDVQHVTGAIPLLRDWLGSPSGPAYVVLYQQPDDVDPSGQLARILATRFRPVATAGGYQVLARR